MKESTDDVVPRRHGLGEHLDALLGVEEPALGLVDADRDDDLVEERGGPAEDVDVTVGHRVEGPGAGGSAHGRLLTGSDGGW